MTNFANAFLMWNSNAFSIWDSDMETLRASFLEAMSRAATFVSIATTNGEAGLAGVTVSSLTSVSADGDYPSLLACIHHQSPAASAILSNRAFCANLLAEDQQDLASLFAGRAGGPHSARFAHTEWTPSDLGQPMLAGAAAIFDCELATSLLWETHHIILGKVRRVHLSERTGALLYGQRGYRRAAQLPLGK